MPRYTMYEERKTEQLQVRITPTMKQALRKMAKEQGCPMSTVIDHIIIQYMSEREKAE